MQKKRILILDDMEKMVEQGYCAIVLRTRLSYIQFDHLQIPDFNPLAQFVVEQYWRPFAIQIYIQFAMIALCPFVVVQREVTFNGKKVIVDVPVALEVGSYTVEVSMDDNFQKHYAVKMKGRYTQPTIHVLQSINYNGPTVSNVDKMDSECGYLHKVWKWIEDRKRESDRLFTKAVESDLYVQRVSNYSTRNNDIQEQRYDDHLRYKINSFGYEEEEEVKLEKSKGLVIIPQDHTTCNFQPTINPYFIQTIELEKNYYDLVDTTLGMNVLNRNRHSAYQKPETQVIEETAQTSRTLGLIISDISFSLQKVIDVIFPDEGQVIISLPHRSMLDLPTITFLHEKGVISREVAHDTYINVVGLHTEREYDRKKMRTNDEE